MAFCAQLFGQIDQKRFELVDLGKNINTPFDESAPIISPDGKTLYFFVANHPENNYGTDLSQDIWVSTKDDSGNWTKAKHLDKPFNIHQFNQVMSVSLDGSTILLRGGTKKNKKGFSLIQKSGNEWSDLTELDVAEYEEMDRGIFSGGFLSYDRKVLLLYFTERPKGKYSDLYVSKQIEGTKYGKPIKLGGTINTYMDEFGMFLQADNKTMYFASNRPGGFGDMDIYKTVRKDDTWLNWSDPENVGAPVSTPEFDAYFSIDNTGEQAFTTRTYITPDGGTLDILGLKPKNPDILLSGYVSERASGNPVTSNLYFNKEVTLQTDATGFFKTTVKNNQDYQIRVSASGYITAEKGLSTKNIYSDTTIVLDFLLESEQYMAKIAGKIKNRKTGESISSSIDFSTNDLEEKQDVEGNYHYTWNVGEDLSISVLKEGFMRFDTIVYTSDEVNQQIEMDILLIPIEVGTTVKLNNIFFDYDRTSLQNSSFKELNKLVEFLENNVTVRIEIGGHTDSRGADSYNQTLSQGRAEAVMNYLIDSGISSARLHAVGYGESIPVDSNDTEEGRADNRRVEFKILEQ